MMIAKVTNLTLDYNYYVKNIVCVNYVDTKIILVNKLGQTFPYELRDTVITILMEGEK